MKSSHNSILDNFVHFSILHKSTLHSIPEAIRIRKILIRLWVEGLKCITLYLLYKMNVSVACPITPYLSATDMSMKLPPRQMLLNSTALGPGTFSKICLSSYLSETHHATINCSQTRMAVSKLNALHVNKNHSKLFPIFAQLMSQFVCTQVRKPAMA